MSGSDRANDSAAYTNSWQRGGTVKHLTLADSGTIRYLEVGAGPPLVLIHTMRTQLDYFQKIIPRLQGTFRVYAVDLPGSGHAVLAPGATPDEPYFRAALVEFLTALNLTNVRLAGESIGGVLALTVAAEVPERVAGVYSLNPYDSGEKFGGSIRRSRFGFTIAPFKLFRQYTTETRLFLKLALSGGLTDGAHMPPDVLDEFHRVGRQKGYRKYEYRLYKAWRSWLGAPEHYAGVRAPVTVVYSELDWSLPSERAAQKELLPGATFVELPGVGHFSSLDAPEAVANVLHRQERRLRVA
jgi:pimeloyl-ACP methyl ester carboxylesterase